MQKILKMFLKHNTVLSGRRLLVRSFTVCHSQLRPQPYFILEASGRKALLLQPDYYPVRMNSSGLIQQQEAPPTESSSPPPEEPPQRQFYVERPDKLLAATMTPELEKTVLETLPNGEFALRKVLAELQHLQTKKPYPMPLPEYLTVGTYVYVI
jgi:hypothetical protein